MKRGPLTPKGFRDILPEVAKKRRVVINQIAEVFEEFGFVPLETPTVEFAETLLGKYGEEEKLIYRFSDRGGRNLALRYDLTVPLARFIANNQNLIQGGIFRRYQIGQVFRGDNPQRGRFREFTQFDIDTIGSTDPREDARIIAATIKAARKIGFPNAIMAVNDRENFKDMPIEVVRAIDKIPKIGKEGAKKELEGKGLPSEIVGIIDTIESSKPTQSIGRVFDLLEKEFQLKENVDFFFDPTLARGLDYYTGTIYELKPSGKSSELSIAGGGRYDKLIGMFAGKDIPAVGIAFGVDRLIELL